MFESNASINALLNYFEQSSENSRVREFVVVALLACKADLIDRWIQAHSGTSIDADLLSEIICHAVPGETVEILFYFGKYLQRPQFEEQFKAAISSANSSDTIRDLISAVHIFNHHNSQDTISIDRNEVMQLLHSSDPDHRITGLKSLKYSDFDVNERLKWIINSLRSLTSHERLGALNRVLEMVEMNIIPESQFSVCREIIQHISVYDSDEINREFSSRLLDMLA